MQPPPELRTRFRKVHRVQAQFLHSTALYRGFVGGRGSGKSWVGAYDMLVRAQPNRTYLIASPTGVLLHDTTFPMFRALAQETGLWGTYHLEQMPEMAVSPTGQSQTKMTPYPTVVLTSGATIRFRTAEDPEKLRGPNLSGAWLDEGSLMPHEAYLISIAALRECGEQGWLSVTFTPKGFSHWTYEQFGKSMPNTAIFHASTDKNPFLPPGFREQLEQQYGRRGLLAQQELGGEFVAVEGAEWPPEYFADDLWFDDFPANFAASAMALDPSKGKGEKTRKDHEPDYSAYVWGGVDAQGVVWIDADLNNVRDTTRMVHDGIGLYRLYHPAALCIEINVFQELLGGEFLRQAKEAKIDHLPLYGVNNTEAKAVRIRTIGPYLAKRELRFRRTPGCKLLVQQLRDFPAGAYDDGPDCLSMFLRMLVYLIAGPQPGRGQPTLMRA